MKKTKFLLLVLMFSITACSRAAVEPSASSGYTAVIQPALGPLISPEFQNEVMVLGTLHLSAHADRLTPAHLENILQTLARYRPTRIGVEVLHPDEIAMLDRRSESDAAIARVLDMFAGNIVKLAESARAVTGMDRNQANVAAASLLGRAAGLGDSDRADLVLYLLAAYEYPSALLQWSYLSPATRASQHETIRARLDKALVSSNEVSSIALALARELGLQRIHAVDSQYDGTRTMSMPESLLEDLYSLPSRRAWGARADTARNEALLDAAFSGNDLLPYFLRMNSPAFMEHDVRQWQWLIEANHESGLDRFRYAMWELRNERIATNVIDAVASRRPERMLVLIGGAHKPYLDEALSDLLSIRLRHISEFARADETRSGHE